jgi:4-carboxymuconolactone decarboxylase
LMYSPDLMSTARAMGDYLRYRSAIGNTLSELVILIAASEWSQDFEWSVHYPIAIKAGIRQDIADAIGMKQRPSKMNSEQELVYDYVTELIKTRHVSDALFEKAKQRFGPQGVVDMTGLLGYYTFLAMQLNAAQYPVPKGGQTLPKATR